MNLGRQLSVGLRLTATKELTDVEASVRRVDDAGGDDGREVTETGITRVVHMRAPGGPS